MSVPPPPARAELLDFPVRALAPTDESALYRITRHQDAQGDTRALLFFGSSGKARFDLLTQGDRLPAATGTCYLGTTPMACFIEKFGDLRVIPSREVAANVLVTVRVKRNVRLVDLCDSRVLGRFGLTAEIWSGGNYIRPQEWARGLHQAGFDGILYGARHDPGGHLRAIGIFGALATNPLVVETVDAISEALIQRAFSEYGLVVEEPPPLV